MSEKIILTGTEHRVAENLTDTFKNYVGAGEEFFTIFGGIESNIYSYLKERILTKDSMKKVLDHIWPTIVAYDIPVLPKRMEAVLEQFIYNQLVHQIEKLEID